MELLENLIQFFQHKKVLILGFGREGKSTYFFLKKNVPSAQITIADKFEQTLQQGSSAKKPDCTCIFGDHYLESLSNEWDIIMKSPGIPLLGPIDKNIKKKITCQPDLFLRFCPNTIIGITGTKGKSTTSSLLYHILTSNGIHAKLNGNIGIPVFNDIDALQDDTIIICELSCHQLEYTKNSPNIAVLINIYPDHLDHYNSYEDYKRAKYNIFLHQTAQDTLFINDTCLDIDLSITETIPSRKIYIGKPYKNYPYCGVTEKSLHTASTDIPLTCVKTNLLGKHNLCNISTVISVAEILGINDKQSLKAIESFKGLAHRMEYVGTYQGVKYYNDSIATIPQATILNAETVPDLTTLIVGGMDRGIDYTPLVQFITNRNFKNVIFAYASGKRIYDMIPVKTDLYFVHDLKQAVLVAKKITKHGSCLFSPAAASYDHFKNFEERGDYFKNLIQQEHAEREKHD